LFEVQQRQEFLQLTPETVSKLEIYSPEDLSKPLVEIADRKLLNEWAAILGSCHYHWLSPADDVETYRVELGYGVNTLRYKLVLDSRYTGLVDLKPFESGIFLFRPSEFTYGTYLCDGLYDYLNRILP
jgi:hypothetical protein